MKKKKPKQIVIYQAKSGAIELRGDFNKETIWATQAQIAEVFDIDRTVATKHINNLIKSREIDEKSNVQKMHIANSDKPVSLYSLDVILVVGYRTNSRKAVVFRKWATKILRKYIVEGYVVNEKKLLEAREKFANLQEAISFLKTKSEREALKGQTGEILNLLSSYSKTLSVLEQYDNNKLKEIRGRKSVFTLEYEKCQDIIKELRTNLSIKNETVDLFGNERKGSFGGIIKGIYQTFGHKELYPTIEDKSSHLLYFIIKDHPFFDGNKRIASFIFVYFLDKNNYLCKVSGEKKINDNALVALALLIAESNPKEKEIMIRIIKNLLVE
ncbi:MAG: virulence protein RhuM/Fic/DOC family protein [Candidatus Zambryskibacteria bacterium]